MPGNRAPRVVRFLVSLLVPRSEREFFLGDLDEMFAAESSTGEQRRSWLRETAGTVPLIVESIHLAWRCLAARHRQKAGDNAAFEFARDVRFGLRMMVRNPGFTAVAIVTLALGIGANTAIFSVANAVLFKPLPFFEPDRLMRPVLVRPAGTFGQANPRDNIWSVPKYEVFKENQQAFSASAMYCGASVTLTGESGPQRVAGERIESPYLGILGIAPVLGVGLTPEDDLPGSGGKVLLSYAFWKRRWGGDPSVVGRSMRTKTRTYTVIGVLPEGFKGLSGRAEIFVPYGGITEWRRTTIWSHNFKIVARLEDNVTPAEARAEMDVVARRIDEAFQTSDISLKGWDATARTLNELRADPALRTSILLLLGAVGFVLLIACVNLANLLLARASGRRREMSIRAAVGAGRSRIVRQLLAEGLVLSVGGGVMGLGLAYLGVEGLRSLGPATHGVLQGDYDSLTVLGLDRIAVDGSTLLVALALALGTGLLFGLVPALRASSTDLTRDLKEGTGWLAGAGRGGRVDGRGVLVVAEFTLAFVLLAGSGLMLKSFLRLHEVDLGFEPAGIQTAYVSLPSGDYDRPEREIFFNELTERIGAIPSVRSVAVGDCPPVSGGCQTTVIRFFDRPPVQEGAEPLLDIHVTGPGFFETLGVPLIRGRTFDSRDRYGEHLVAVISQRTADEFWPGEDPLGKIVGLAQGDGFWDGTEIVGIVGDVHFESIESAPKLTAYIPHGQDGNPGGYLFARVDGDPTAVVGPIRRVVAELDSDVPVTAVRTMEDRVSTAAVRTTFSASLLSLFAVVALVLSAVGIFGVLSYLVAQQTREIGIRMALGAQRNRVFRQVLQRAMVLTTLGVLLGGSAALGLLRFMSSLLFEVRPDDPGTLLLVALLLSAVSLAAAYVPAWKATRVEPLEVLKG